MPMDEREEIWIAEQLRELRYQIDPDPWQSPKTWRQFIRQRQWNELKALEQIRQEWIEWIAPFVRRVKEYIKQEGFDPKEAEHFAAFQSLLVAVPQTIKEMRANIKALAELYGHLARKPEDDRLPAGVNIQQAFIHVASRMGAFPHSVPSAEVKVLKDAGEDEA